MIIHAADGTPIGKTSFGNKEDPYMAYLKYTDNAHLIGAYATMTGNSYTKNVERYTPYVGGSMPADAYTSIKINSITPYYN